MDSLLVDVNRGNLHSIDVAASSFRAEGPFEVVVENHGAAVHVYLQVDDDLAEAVSLSAVNHFVKEGGVRRVPVDVDGSKAPVRGRLKVVTGYGRETEYVTVTVDEPEETVEGVDVDESLGTPRPRPEPEEDRSPLGVQGVPVLTLGALAIVVALLAALAVGGGMTLLAVLILLVGVGVGALLLRG